MNCFSILVHMFPVAQPVGNPSCLHTTEEASTLHPVIHTEEKVPSKHTSTKPSIAVTPPVKRTPPAVHASKRK